jgi:hypothetical protein
MKYKKLKKLIQGPLRFHHQDIHEELETLKSLVQAQNEILGRILSKLENTDALSAADAYKKLVADSWR